MTLTVDDIARLVEENERLTRENRLLTAERDTLRELSDAMRADNERLHDLVRDQEVEYGQANCERLRLRALLAPLREMAAQVATQDNLATEGPIYLVQERHRFYDSQGDEDEHVWIDGEGNESAEEPDDSDGWHEVPVRDTWEAVQPFFTMAGAEAYIEANRHRMTDPRVYVDGSYRNGEWKAVRALLLALDGVPE